MNKIPAVTKALMKENTCHDEHNVSPRAGQPYSSRRCGTHRRHEPNLDDLLSPVMNNLDKYPRHFTRIRAQFGEQFGLYLLIFNIEACFEVAGRHMLLAAVAALPARIEETRPLLWRWHIFSHPGDVGVRHLVQQDG